MISTYWRYEQLLHERLAEIDPRRRAHLRTIGAVIGASLTSVGALLIAPIYVTVPALLFDAGLLSVAALNVGAAAASNLDRRCYLRLWM